MSHFVPVSSVALQNTTKSQHSVTKYIYFVLFFLITASHAWKTSNIFLKKDTEIKNDIWAQFSIHHRGQISKISCYLNVQLDILFLLSYSSVLHQCHPIVGNT